MRLYLLGQSLQMMAGYWLRTRRFTAFLAAIPCYCRASVVHAARLSLVSHSPKCSMSLTASGWGDKAGSQKSHHSTRLQSQER